MEVTYDALKKRVAELEEQNKKLRHVISVLVETDKLRTALKELEARQNPSQHAVTAVELLNDAAPY